jgi:O-6-methylguanine DNA methyltransferase
LREFRVPVAWRGSPFQQRVWEHVRQIPYGQTTTYEALANAIGKASAARAVGHANGQNPIAIVVPCHRVVQKNGSLAGYGGGLWRKAALLHLERELAFNRAG